MVNEKTYNYVVCINNTGYEASLEVRKIYRVIKDKEVENKGLLKIIDESGEDYLYPIDFFIQIDLPQKIKQALQT